jgi:hypothetical protein
VVTRFKYRLHPVSTAIGGLLVLPATPAVIADFIAETAAAPEELTTITNILPAPPLPFLPPEVHGHPVLMSTMMYAGDIEAGERVLKRFQRITTPLVDLLHAMRYAEILHQDEASAQPALVSRTLYLNGIDRAGAETMLDYLQAGKGFRAVQLRVLGGAVARVPVEETAYAHRQAPILANLAAFYNTAEEQSTSQAWLDAFSNALPEKISGAYVNFLDSAGKDRLVEVYPGRTGERLAQVKARYDPDNLFCLNHNIEPH